MIFSARCRHKQAAHVCSPVCFSCAKEEEMQGECKKDTRTGLSKETEEGKAIAKKVAGSIRLLRY